MAKAWAKFPYADKKYHVHGRDTEEGLGPPAQG